MALFLTLGFDSTLTDRMAGRGIDSLKREIAVGGRPRVSALLLAFRIGFASRGHSAAKAHVPRSKVGETLHVRLERNARGISGGPYDRLMSTAQRQASNMPSATPLLANASLTLQSRSPTRKIDVPDLATGI